MQSESRIFNGIGASGGVAIGKVCLLDRRQVRVPRHHINPEHCASEVSRLEQAITTSYEQLESIRSQFVHDGMDHHAILEAHEMMIRDPALLEEASRLILSEHINAEWAISRVISRLRRLFEEMEDSYLRQRRGDIDFVGDRIIRNLTGKTADISELGPLKPGTIIVAHDLGPADTVLLAEQNVTALITEIGGKTSHSSIIARSMSIPAAVGVHGIFDVVGDGDLIAVDGFNGSVELLPDPTRVQYWQSKAASAQQNWQTLLKETALPAETEDHHTISIAGNIEIPQDAHNVFEHGGESIGLYRTEFLYLQKNEPDEELHYQTYTSIAKLAQGRSVTIRTVDIGADKLFGAHANDPVEPNPVLGLRGIRHSLNHPEMFKMQLAGILRAGVHGHLRILLPMITAADEIRQTRSLITEVSADLKKRKLSHTTEIPVGAMIEVPCAVFAADSICREVDFLSVGTNDLLQYLLAIDRGNDRVAYLYRPLHPAVLRSLKYVIDFAQRHHTPLSICGEMAGEIKHVPTLLGLGFRDLSMNAGTIPRIKRLIREINISRCQELVAKLLETESIEDIENLAIGFLHEELASESSVWTPSSA